MMEEKMPDAADRIKRIAQQALERGLEFTPTSYRYIIPGGRIITEEALQEELDRKGVIDMHVPELEVRERKE